MTPDVAESSPAGAFKGFGWGDPSLLLASLYLCGVIYSATEPVAHRARLTEAIVVGCTSALLAYLELCKLGAGFRPVSRIVANQHGLSLGGPNGVRAEWSQVVALTLDGPNHARVVVKTRDGFRVYACKRSWWMNRSSYPMPPEKNAEGMFEAAAFFVAQRAGPALEPQPDSRAPRDSWLLAGALLLPSVVLNLSRDWPQAGVALALALLALPLVRARLLASMRFGRTPYGYILSKLPGAEATGRAQVFDDWRVALKKHKPRHEYR